MRIISGSEGSRTIVAPKGLDTRPTLDKVKEALFSMLTAYVEDAYVLDLYAGSGALSLEALSRGAKKAVLVDVNRQAQEAIQKNIESLSYTGKARLLKMADTHALELLKTEGKTFDLVFLDPPYTLSVNKVLTALLTFELIDQNSVIVVEHDEKKEVEVPQGYVVFKEKKYKTAALTFLRRA